MSFVNQTPQRPLPGGFINTPAPSRFSSSAANLPPPAFGRSSSQSQVPQRSTAPLQSQTVASQPAGAPAPVASAPKELLPAELAKNAINDKLEAEGRFPPLEEYIGQEISNDYKMDSPAWAPFQKIKTYEIPDRVMEQVNTADLSIQTGLFAELHHAWIAVDSVLYLWDYTHPNPDQAELIGFEELSQPITAVHLVRPRPGVFVPTITHLLVVASNSDLNLVGVASSKSAAGVTSITLYNTGMQVSMKGIQVSCITGSDKTGRIFVGARTTNDIYEITYQKEEEWFASKCGKKCQTEKALPVPLATYLPLKGMLSLIGAGQPSEHVNQLVVDDSRGLLYALSSLSTIQVFHIKPGFSLPRLITKTIDDLTTSIRHMVPPPEFLSQKESLVAISAIASSESSRLNLMVTTAKGMRIFLSATSGNYYNNDGLPTSMQPYHVKLPPIMPDSLPRPGQAAQATASTAQAVVPGGRAPLGASRPIPIKTSTRFPPGYFACLVGLESENDNLFLSAPDTGSITFQYEQGNPRRFMECGQWIPLHSQTQSIGLMTKPFAAASSPKGFGNELAVQFDQTASEIAILTNSGIHTIRRRRLVDIFASAMRQANSDDGFKNELTKFQQRYGAREMCATALAVACGQAMDVTADARVAKIRDDDIMVHARDTFVKHGGMPSIKDYEVINDAPTPDNVKLSHRAEGLLVYLTRLVRPVWKAPLLKETITPTGGLSVSSTIPVAKLQEVQHDVLILQEFLKEQTKFIAGLAGPESLSGVGSKQEEIALRGEHRILYAIVKSIDSIIEGIAFVQVLFDDPVDELVLALSEESRRRVRELTYERLFCTPDGREMAKELVKAIVNRSIAKGSNVDTVAEALRRRCGSFCSADDVIIFKAQELLKKASEAGAESSSARSLLNESLKLFEKVAGSLSAENLRKATEQYIAKFFYGGAIRLALTVAKEVDRPGHAFAWIKDGSPANDKRKAAYDKRTGCYELICMVIAAVDKAWGDIQSSDELTINNMAKRKAEAYSEINGSDDEVFQTYLYDWYISQGESERLLEVDSDHVVKYLERQSKVDLAHADLLWRYFARHSQFLDAAKVQLLLAKSGFDIKLTPRIEYLSRAKANASTRTNGLQDFGRSRQPRQEVVREINDLLDLANIQQDILHRLMGDSRLTADRKPEIEKELDGRIMSLDDLYNTYADQASYYDICLLIYELADYRNAADIQATWANLISSVDKAAKDVKDATPFQAVASEVQSLGRRLNCSDTTFPIPILLPVLLEYAFSESATRIVTPNTLETWPIDTLLTLLIPHETLVTVLEDLFFSPEAVWTRPQTKSKIAQLLVYTIDAWFDLTARAQGVVFGSDENAVKMLELVKEVLAWKAPTGVGLTGVGKSEAERVREKVERVLW